jgi:hypothetical protein
MTLLGIELQRPEFWSLTQAVGVAVALWLLLTLSPLGASNAITAGANLAAILVGCLSNEIGIQVRKGGRHLALNIGLCVVVLVAYHAVAAAFT